MQTQKLHEDDGQRTFALIFETGDELLAGLQDFARRETVSAAQFSAIGAFRDVVLAYFDWESRQYQKRTIAEQVEVASLTGDIAEGPDGKPAIHIHAVLGRRDLSALAGHVVEAHVRPTLELVVVEQPTHLCKRYDPESGLALIRVPRAERR